jgi:hypothetical protein
LIDYIWVIYLWRPTLPANNFDFAYLVISIHPLWRPRTRRRPANNHRRSIISSSCKYAPQYHCRNYFAFFIAISLMLIFTLLLSRSLMYHFSIRTRATVPQRFSAAIEYEENGYVSSSTIAFEMQQAN